MSVRMGEPATTDGTICTCPEYFHGDQCQNGKILCICHLLHLDSYFVCFTLISVIPLTDVRMNHCLNDPCENWGTCHNGTDGYICTCPEYFHGDQCQHGKILCSCHLLHLYPYFVWGYCYFCYFIDRCPNELLWHKPMWERRNMSQRNWYIHLHMSWVLLWRTLWKRYFAENSYVLPNIHRYSIKCVK